MTQFTTTVTRLMHGEGTLVIEVDDPSVEVSIDGAGDDNETAAGTAECLADEVTPAFTAEMEEECQRLFDLLDDELRQIAQWRLEGYSNQKIADMTGHILTWVERNFLIIRRRSSERVE